MRKQLALPNSTPAKRKFSGRSHHGKISSAQRFAIKEIEKVSVYRFAGTTRYQAMLFISLFIKDKTIYPEGLFPRDIMPAKVKEITDESKDIKEFGNSLLVQ